MNNQQFTCQLMQWHIYSNTRKMPWKGEKDPYKIWLCEVILQQTRVEQGSNYYQKFIHHYPTINSLAEAKDDEVFKLWEGLGYYNRCKNLLFTARYINNNLGGIFPQAYQQILSLKGIGPYTAAAISSFAYNLPYAVVDGNVLRVLARVFEIYTPVDNSKALKQFTSLAQQVLDKQFPGAFNQAIMDFGATICKPFAPACISCPLQNICKAYKKGKVNVLPVKEKLLLKKNRWFTWFLFATGDKILVHKRTQQDIWQNLFQFYLLETEAKPLCTPAALTQYLYNVHGIKKATITNTSALYSQHLTHQNIHAYFIQTALPQIPPGLKHYTWLRLNEIKQLPFPKIINQYLRESGLTKKHGNQTADVLLLTT